MLCFSDDGAGSSGEKKSKPPLNILRLKLFMECALHRFFTFPFDYYRRARIRPEILAECGFYMAEDYQSLVCHFCSLEIKVLEKWRDCDQVYKMMEKHLKESPRCPLGNSKSNNIPLGDLNQICNYKFESHRLFSMVRSDKPGVWCHVPPYDLSKSGFYYTGDEDNVR
jgi:hypothetical protein